MNKYLHHVLGALPPVAGFAFWAIFAQNASAQLPDTSLRRLDLPQAVALALANNLNVRSGQYEVDAQRALQRTAGDAGKANLTWMGGQYNSINFDHNVTVTQTLPFPLLVSRRADYLAALTRSTETRLQVTRNELISQVKSTYTELVLAKARRRLLAGQDSLFAEFSRSARARYRAGEGTLLAQASAESQLQENKLLLTRNEADIAVAQTQLQTLLNLPQPVTSTADALPVPPLPPPPPDTLALEQNPLLAHYRQQTAVARQFTRVEKAQLLPDLTLGYFNQSLIGTQIINNTERRFDGSYRFQGFELGLSVPLWARPLRARVRSAAFGERAAQTQEQFYRQTLRQQWRQAALQYEKFRTSLDYFEQTALPTARLLLENAQKAYRAGEIGYLEYAQALNQALGVRLQHLETLHQASQAVIYLEFLAGNG